MNHPLGVVEDLHPHGAGWPVRRFCKCDRRRDVWSDDAPLRLDPPRVVEELPGGRFPSGSPGPKAARNIPGAELSGKVTNL